MEKREEGVKNGGKKSEGIRKGMEKEGIEKNDGIYTHTKSESYRPISNYKIYRAMSSKALIKITSC